MTNRRKVGTTSSHHAPYDLGYTRATMAGTERSEAVRWSESQKAGPSSDRSLQLDSVKSESLVISGQHTEVNTFPGLVHTARHTTKVYYTRSRWGNRRAYFSTLKAESKLRSVAGIVAASKLRRPGIRVLK